MTLPPYPGQPQPEEPQKPEAPQPPVTPPPPPAPPVAPPAPAYPGGGTATPPPPAPPGGPFPPPPHQPFQPYAGPNDGSASYSGLAIASFVCSLTCCLGIPAIILGAFGIAKTGQGKARGRWMAVAGVVLGVLGTLLVAAVAIALFAVSDRVVTPANAEAGQCVEVASEDDTVTMIDLGCSVDHNGQIFAVITPTQADLDAGRTQLQLCVTRLAGAFPDVPMRAVDGRPRLDLPGDEVEVSAASARTRLEAGSPVACWIEAVDGVLEADHVR